MLCAAWELEYKHQYVDAYDSLYLLVCYYYL